MLEARVDYSVRSSEPPQMQSFILLLVTALP